MSELAAKIAQWLFVVGAVVCLFVVAGLTESRPTITYTQPDDQQVVVSCAAMAWGNGEHQMLPSGGSGVNWWRVEEGEDVLDEIEAVDSDALSTDCLVAGIQRQHHVVWTATGGLLLAGAGGYISLLRRITARR